MFYKCFSYVNPLLKTMNVRMMFRFLVLCETFSIVLSAIAKNEFLFVQNGEIPSASCMLREDYLDNSTVSPGIQCGLKCNSDPLCVGVDITEEKPGTCRHLFGFPALIPTYTTSRQTARYQKVYIIHIIYY